MIENGAFNEPTLRAALELLATVLSAMIAVPTSFVRALNDVPRRMVNVLQAIKEQKEKQAA